LGNLGRVTVESGGEKKSTISKGWGEWLGGEIAVEGRTLRRKRTYGNKQEKREH